MLLSVVSEIIVWLGHSTIGSVFVQGYLQYIYTVHYNISILNYVHGHASKLFSLHNITHSALLPSIQHDIIQYMHPDVH